MILHGGAPREGRGCSLIVVVLSIDVRTLRARIVTSMDHDRTRANRDVGCERAQIMLMHYLPPPRWEVLPLPVLQPGYDKWDAFTTNAAPLLVPGSTEVWLVYRGSKACC